VAAARAGDGGDVVWRDNAVAGEREPPFGRFVEARHAVEDGRLAGAVGADQCRDIAAAGQKTETVHCDQAAKPHR